MTLTSLFSPIEIRGKRIRNRIVQPGQGTGFGHLDGRITERHLRFHEAKARGGVGLIIFEHTGIDRRGNVIPLGEPLIDDDRFIPGLREVAELVHREGAGIIFQLGHGGRRAVYSPAFYLAARLPGLEWLAREGTRYFPVLYARLLRGAWRVARRPKGPSEGPPSWGFYRHGRRFEHTSPGRPPRELKREEIRELVRRHGEAARRARAAGADGVEVYCCHGYLLSQFYSPALNQRTDEYGGDLEGRMRFTLEVIREVRRVVGEETIVSLRLNAADFIDGGADIEAAKQAAVLGEEAGADVINVTAGLYGSCPPMIPSMAEPQGLYVPLAEAIKKVVRIPVIGGIRIVDPVHADTLIAEGRMDMVIMGRALLADPEMPNKAREGRLADVRQCIGCNQCLEITEGAEAGIHCLVNPSLGREWRLPLRPARRQERIAVVGGGPAGMTAAEVLARRGYGVVLYEREGELGGRLRWMARVPGQDETGTFIKSMERALESLGVELRREEATAQALREAGFEKVIVATGGVPAVPAWLRAPGVTAVGMDEVFAAGDVDDPVLAWGDDLYALATALYLAAAGKRVTVASRPRFFPLDPMDVSTNGLYLKMGLAERGVEVFPARAVRGVYGGVLELVGGRRAGGVSTVVACTLREDGRLAAELRSLGMRTFVVGDARWPRKSAAAACEAWEVAAGV